jgi:hypothetical protein
MLVFRWIMLLSMVLCAALFVLFAFTGNNQYKKHGLNLLKFTLAILFVFFGVLIFQRI